MLSAATFSKGFTGVLSTANELGRQHIWMQSRPFNGSQFSGSVSNMASTLPLNPQVSDVANSGYDMDASQIFFSTKDGPRMVFADDSKAKVLKNNTSISSWEVADNIAIVAIGARAFCMKRTIAGMNELAAKISNGSIVDNLSTVNRRSISTGYRYASWIAVFDKSTPPEKFGRTVSRLVDTQALDLAIALGGGIKFYIDGAAHVWYAGYVFKINPLTIPQLTNIGNVEVIDVTATVLADSDSNLRIGNGSGWDGDFVQGFVAGYANTNWFVISNTRDQTSSLHIFKIENGKLTYDSSVLRSTMNFEFNQYTNTPLRMNVNIDDAGSTIIASGHIFADEADGTNVRSNEYLTGYGNPDQISVLEKNGTSWSVFGAISSAIILNTGSSSDKRAITAFADSTVLHESGSIKTVLVSSGSDIAFNSAYGVDPNEEFYVASSQQLRSRPSKIHKISLTEIAPTAVAECNDLLPVSNTNFVGSTYANLNFWTYIPMSARNGSQSIVFSSHDNYMYFSTMDDMISMSAKGEGTWELQKSSALAKLFSVVSAFKYPLPSSGVTCVQCAIFLINNINTPKPARVSVSASTLNVSGNLMSGKRALSYRPTASPSIIGIDSVPSSASAGLPDVLPASYGNQIAAPYMHKLNSTPRNGAIWNSTEGYLLSYKPSTRLFLKRYPFSSASPSFGVGSPLLTGLQFTPQYAASFATCPPVWDLEEGLWSWAGLRPIRMSSSHTHDSQISNLGPLMQMNWSDIFGMSCFSARTQDIFVIRETKRAEVSSNDDLSDTHKNQLSSFREETVEAGGADTSIRSGQIVRITAPTNPDAPNGQILATVALDDFFTSGSGSRFFMNGPGSVMVGASNASSNAKDTAKICKSGISAFARERVVSPLGPVLIIIDDSLAMDAIMGVSPSPLPSATSFVVNEFEVIPADSTWLPKYSPLDNSYPSNLVSMSTSYSRKYAVDSSSPVYSKTMFNRAMKSIISMFDPVDGDLFIGDQILVACSSSLDNVSSSQSYPAPVAGVASPLTCVCQEDLIAANMRMSSWKTRSTSDIFNKIIIFNPDGSSTNGVIFDRVKPSSNTQKFSHMVIMCGEIPSATVPDSITPSQFASSMYSKLTAIGATGLLKIDASVHVVDLNPQSKREHKKALGSYGTYCTWYGGGA
jgi:hypothetical protein